VIEVPVFPKRLEELMLELPNKLVVVELVVPVAAELGTFPKSPLGAAGVVPVALPPPKSELEGVAVFAILAPLGLFETAEDVKLKEDAAVLKGLVWGVVEEAFVKGKIQFN
jgi:hypothetical protein